MQNKKKKKIQPGHQIFDTHSTTVINNAAKVKKK